MRKAINATFHSSIHVKGPGEFGAAVPSQSKTIDDLVMYYGPEGLICDGVYKGLRISFAVPTANIKCVNLYPLDPADKPKA